MTTRRPLILCMALVGGCYEDAGDHGEPWAGEDGSTGTIASGDGSASAGSDGGSATAGDADGGSDSTDPTGDTSDPSAGSTDGDSGDDSAGGNTVPEGVSPEEAELVDLMNAYRMDNDLPAIPLCPSLALVARTHCVDLVEESPHTVGNCNMHSWSDAGPWSGCCYTPDHAEGQCMWDKPRELSDYPGNGYEISVGGGSSISPAAALAAWQGSPGHNDVILNRGIWSDRPWGCIGAGLYMGYSHVWFGEEPDPAM